MGDVLAGPGVRTLVAAEAFSPTVQGEGPSLGRRCGFVRLSGCNLSCTWCDSAFTWDGTRFDLRAENQRRPVDDLIAAATVGDPGMVVVTGGEPLLHQHQDGWLPLLDGLRARGAEIEVETNGTRAPTAETVARVARFNVSPKLAHAGDPAGRRIVPDVLGVFATLTEAGRAAFKFVARDEGDVDEVQALGLPPHMVWVMPEGTSAEEVTAGLGRIADRAIGAGFNVTTRLHVLCWGNERAR